MEDEMNLFIAGVCEEAELFEEVIKLAEDYVEKHNSINNTWKNHLITAYRREISQRKQSIRILHSIQQKESKNTSNVLLIQQNLRNIAIELQNILENYISILKKLLNMLSSEDNTQVEEKISIYSALTGAFTDFYEISQNKLHNEEAKNYEELKQKCFDHLPATNKQKISYALSLLSYYPVIYPYMTKEKKKELFLYARNVFSEAVEKIDEIDELDYNDTVLSLQLLKDNLSLWEAENEEEKDQ